MSHKLDMNDNTLMILPAFSNGYENEYYIREMCRHGSLTAAIVC